MYKSFCQPKITTCTQYVPLILYKVDTFKLLISIIIEVNIKQKG